MRNEFMRILADYPSARKETFRQHPMAAFVRIAAAAAVRAALGATQAGLMIEGHPGQGGWADSPWIGILDPVVTTDPKSGYYACYLFPSDMSGLVLSLQLGMEEMKARLGHQAARELLGAMRHHALELVPEHAPEFTAEGVRLVASARGSRAAFYEGGHVFGRTYGRDLPGDEQLASDLRSMIRL